MLESLAIWLVATSKTLAIIASALTEIIGSLTIGVGAVLAGLTSICGIMAGLAAMLPPPENKGILSTIHKWINIAGFNVGNAINATQSKLK
jgi:hypothetical protein